jgi:hypothetical protein
MPDRVGPHRRALEQHIERMERRIRTLRAARSAGALGRRAGAGAAGPSTCIACVRPAEGETMRTHLRAGGDRRLIRFTNTLTRQLEEFEPQGDVVTMYVCGITPYDESHIGHAMSYIVFDVVKRYLQWRGYRVKHVQNFTDIGPSSSREPAENQH